MQLFMNSGSGVIQFYMNDVGSSENVKFNTYTLWPLDARIDS